MVDAYFRGKRSGQPFKVANHHEDAAIVSMEDPTGIGSMTTMSSLVVEAATSTPVTIEGITAGSEKLPGTKEVGAEYGFFS